MPLDERWYRQVGHPLSCRCEECKKRRLSPPPGFESSTIDMGQHVPWWRKSKYRRLGQEVDEIANQMFEGAQVQAEKTDPQATPPWPAKPQQVVVPKPRKYQRHHDPLVLRPGGRLLKWALLLGIGGALCLVLYPLFPQTLRGWVESGQAKVQSAVQRKGASGALPLGQTPTPTPTRPLPRIDATQAKAVLDQFFAKFNAYDEKGLEKLTTSAYFAQVRPDLIWATALMVKYHPLTTSIQKCTDTECVFLVLGSVSGSMGTESLKREYSVVLQNDGLRVAGHQGR